MLEQNFSLDQFATDTIIILATIRTFSDISSLLNFTPTIDLFASKFSCKLPCYLSLVPDPEAICIDASSFSWTNNLYAFPTLPLIYRIVNKLVSDEATNFVLITTAWPSLVCLPLLLSMLISHPIFISSHLLLGEIPTRRPFNLMAWPISTSVGDVKAYQQLAVKPLPPVSPSSTLSCYQRHWRVL